MFQNQQNNNKQPCLLNCNSTVSISCLNWMEEALERRRQEERREVFKVMDNQFLSAEL